jgi:hypothetical protein
MFYFEVIIYLDASKVCTGILWYNCEHIDICMGKTQLSTLQ